MSIGEAALFLWFTIAAAHAVSPEALLARVAETAALRALRLDTEAPAHPPETYATLLERAEPLSGLIEIEGAAVPLAWGIGLFEVSIGRYWAALADDVGKVAYTRTAYAEILSGAPCTSPRRVFQFVEVPWIADRWWVNDTWANDAIAERTQGRVREQRWATNGDFTVDSPTAQEWTAKGVHPVETRGSWLLIDVEGTHTLVEYSTASDPGGAIPKRMAATFAARGIPDVLAGMAAAATAGRSGCPVW